MSTIRERDAAWKDYRQSPDSESPSLDRRVILKAGDAMAQMLQMQHPAGPTWPGFDGAPTVVWCDGCDAPESECWAVTVIAAWNEATG